MSSPEQGSIPSLPPHFVLGVASSAYQIEGSVNADGRGESIWDRFTHGAGNVVDGSDGDIACASYARIDEDLGLLGDLGVSSYRLSIAWPRILPEGRGKVNPAGLDFYDRLIDALLGRGIMPAVTLYHWDLPQPLQDLGGWQARDTASAFASYAEIVVRRLGDRVWMWFTHNEPWCSSFLGHLYGQHAPGLRSLPVALQVAHHILLSHGLAVDAIRASGASTSMVGIAPNLWPAHPATQSAADRAAARRQDGHSNRWFLDPLAGRGYPADMLDWYAEAAPIVEMGDMEVIARPIDILGVNYYSRALVAADADASPLGLRDVRVPDETFTATGWEIYPAGLFEILARIHRDYAFPALAVTENGVSLDDTLDDDGGVDDPARIAFIAAHLAEATRAIDAGVPLIAYFAWSFLDCFEWADGYTQRFGLVRVDRVTRHRTVKRSGRWFAAVTERVRSAGHSTSR